MSAPAIAPSPAPDDPAKVRAWTVLEPCVHHGANIQTHLTTLANRIDVLPSQVGGSEFLFLQALESIKRAKDSVASACEVLRKIMGQG